MPSLITYEPSIYPLSGWFGPRQPFVGQMKAARVMTDPIACGLIQQAEFQVLTP